VLWSFQIPIQRHLLPQSWLDPGFQESSWSPYVCEYAEVPLVRCRSRYSKIFTTLRSATSSSSSTLVRERNLRIRSIRVRLRTSVYHYNITSR
jgi:hypothetical protein